MKTLHPPRLKFELQQRWLDMGLPPDSEADEELDKVIEKGHVLIVHTRPDGCKVVDVVDPAISPIVVL